MIIGAEPIMTKVDIDPDVFKSLQFLSRKYKCSISNTIAYCIAESFGYRWDILSLKQWYAAN